MAVGLVNTPEVLFLDEPTTGLDPHLRVEVLNFLLKINRKYGTTMVIVSQDIHSVLSIGHRAILLDGSTGGIDAVGPPRELAASPPTPLVARFFHSAEGQAGREVGAS